jgi:hypothetical protein
MRAGELFAPRHFVLHLVDVRLVKGGTNSPAQFVKDGGVANTPFFEDGLIFGRHRSLCVWVGLGER